MQESSCAVKGVSSVALLMMRYQSLYMSAAHLAAMLHDPSATLPRMLHCSHAAVLLPDELRETLLLLRPYDSTLAGMADVFLRLKAGIEKVALEACPSSQRRLIEAEYRRIASEITRMADAVLPVEAQRAAAMEHFF